MSSATLNGVGSTLKMSSSKVIDLVSDEENSEIDDAPLHGVVRGISRGIPQHHQNAASEDLEAALDANENSVGDEFEEEDDDDDDGGEDDDDSIDSSFMEDAVEALTDDNILDDRKFTPYLLIVKYAKNRYQILILSDALARKVSIIVTCFENSGPENSVQLLWKRTLLPLKSS